MKMANTVDSLPAWKTVSLTTKRSDQDFLCLEIHALYTVKSMQLN